MIKIILLAGVLFLTVFVGTWIITNSALDTASLSSSPVESEELVPPAEPIPSVPMVAGDIPRAQEALTMYFQLLSDKNYLAALVYHGSNPQLLRERYSGRDISDRVPLLRTGCETKGWKCLRVAHVVSHHQLSPSEVEFIVQFQKPQWSTDTSDIFSRGPCCGAPDTGERETDFPFVVRKSPDGFLVMTPPVYVP